MSAVDNCVRKHLDTHGGHDMCKGTASKTPLRPLSPFLGFNDLRVRRPGLPSTFVAARPGGANVHNWA